MPRHSILIPALALVLSACSGGSGGGASAPAGGTTSSAAQKKTPGPQPAPKGRTSVHLSAINELDASNHPETVGVHPGDVVRFAADYFVEGRAQNAAAVEFNWRADGGQACEVGNEESCYNSGFLFDEQGVNFVVPESMPAQITILVWSKRFDSKMDSITLVNLGAEDNGRADQRYQRFPRWNPEWNGERRGRWEIHWDHHWNNDQAPQPGANPGWNRGNGGHQPGRGQAPQSGPQSGPQAGPQAGPDAGGNQGRRHAPQTGNQPVQKPVEQPGKGVRNLTPIPSPTTGPTTAPAGQDGKGKQNGNHGPNGAAVEQINGAPAVNPGDKDESGQPLKNKR